MAARVLVSACDLSVGVCVFCLLLFASCMRYTQQVFLLHKTVRRNLFFLEKRVDEIQRQIHAACIVLWLDECYARRIIESAFQRVESKSMFSWVVPRVIQYDYANARVLDRTNHFTVTGLIWRQSGPLAIRKKAIFQQTARSSKNHTMWQDRDTFYVSAIIRFNHCSNGNYR